MLALRRALYALLVLVCCAAPLALLWRALGHGGWTIWEGAIFALVALITPWIATLFASSLVGFLILHFAPDPLAATWAPQSEAPPAGRTAIAVAVRNEDLAAVLARCVPLLDGLPVETFDLWVLSDTQDEALAAAEAAALAAFRAGRADARRVHYRRRTGNEGFKAGNVMQFLRAHGQSYAFMVSLDADSVMSAAKVDALVRQLAAHPDVALIQTLIAARPSADAFPRLFQFGMRHGMRAYAAGIAWWQGPDGPYWGHNAVLRVAAFRDHAELPTLPGGARILSHDQVEAAMLRAAGFAVRLDPREGGSWEANPPDMLAFIARDIRWMAGNLQYFALLRMPLFRAMGRVQLGLAILLFLMSPVLFLVSLLALANAHDPAGSVGAASGLAATWLLALMYWSPKLFGAAQIALDPGNRAAWGGAAVLARGVTAEFAFDLLLMPIRIVAHSVGMAAMLLGRKVGWAPQQREAARLPLHHAVRALWWHTLAGAALCAGFAAAGALPLLWALPFLLGPLLAIPFCLATSDPQFGRWLTRRRIAALSEEFDPASPFPPFAV
jgi:membrane glycosyltransferase